MCVVHSQQKNARHVMPAESIVEIKDLRFAYADRPLLKGIDLAIRKGQVVGIMGASGSGKSTLLRLIGGQLVPGGGYVKVAGKTVHELSRDDLYKLRRKMGMQFQAGGLFTDLSVYENIAFQMREHTDLPETMIRDLVLMKLAAVGLRGAAQLMPAELSGGMSRRVGLARAISLDPMLIMYDEPFAGLDPISCNVVGNLIRHLNDALGATSIVVSYDAAESMRIIDYVYLISDGVVAAQGAAAQLRDSRDPFVRQFLDGTPDGPVPFHYAHDPYRADLGIDTARVN
jgi:phospholipid/cholesterol/gamma-HCH transport system ATP-binding protein